MKTFAAALAMLMTTSVPVVANAEQGGGSVNRAHCYTHTVEHPDGSTESHTSCFTASDGAR